MANYVDGQRRKIDLAIAGLGAGIDNLEDDDVAGVISFSAGKDANLVSALTSDRPGLLRAVRGLKPRGGTTLMMEAIDKAAERLEADDAKRKHIVLLSDGKSDDTKSDFLALAEQIAEARISITAIAIGDANAELLTQLAETSGGHFVPVQNLQELPSVLTEAVRETQRYIVQEPFEPILVDPNEPIVRDIEPLPRLHGYIATTQKDIAQVFIRSHKDEPILAGWNIGLGKAVAWTSDAKPAWAAEWIPWHNFGKFWGQVVNWTLPSKKDGAADFDLTVTPQNGRGAVVIDTASTPATYGFTFDVSLARSDGEGTVVELHRVTPTRYSGEFPVRERGSYLVTAQKKRDGQVESTDYESLVLSYPAEFAEFETNRQLLNELASQTNGIFEPSPKQIVQRRGTPIEHLKPLSFTLLVVSLILFVLEMILRRFSIASGYLAELKTQLRLLYRRDDHASSPTLSRLRQTKATSDAVASSRRLRHRESSTSRDLTAETSTTSADFAPSSVSQRGYQHRSASDSESATTGNIGRLLQAKSRARNNESSG
jgi:uncharacterized protein YegL